MKNRKERITKTLTVLMAALLTMNIGISKMYAEEEAPLAPDTENMTVEEANALIEEYNGQVDEYNEVLMEEYEAEVAAVEAHNAEEDAKVEQNEKEIAAYEAVQAQVEADSQKGITETRTTDAEDIPTDYEVTVEAKDAKTIKVTEAEEKSGKTVKVMNLHIFYDEDCNFDGYMAADLSQVADNEDIMNHTALAEWETIEVDENDVVQVISESEAMGYRSSSFYKRFEGYTNGFWMPAGNVFSSTAVDSEWAWYKGASQIASYDMGTTDRRSPVDMFSLYMYSFYRYGAEPEKVEKYIADYKEAPEAPELLEKMDLLEEKQEEEVKEEVIPVETEDDDKKEIEPIEVIEEKEEIEVEEEAPVIEVREVAPVKEEIAAAPVKPVNTAPTVEIRNEEVPQASFEEIAEAEENIEIADDIVPTAVPAEAQNEEAPKYWALANLICALASILAALGMILTINRKEEDEENEEEEENRTNLSKLLGIVPAVLAALVFILTEDIRNTMIFTDRYTLLMVLFPLASLLTAVITANRKEDNEESDLAETPAA